MASRTDEGCSTSTASSPTCVSSPCTVKSPMLQPLEPTDCHARTTERINETEAQTLQKSSSCCHMETRSHAKPYSEELGQEFNLQIVNVRDAFAQCIDHLRKNQANLSSTENSLDMITQLRAVVDELQDVTKIGENANDVHTALQSLQQEIEHHQLQQRMMIHQFIDNTQMKLGSLESAVLMSLECANDGAMLMNKQSERCMRLGEVLESTLGKLSVDGTGSFCESHAITQLQLAVKHLESDMRVVADKFVLLESKNCSLGTIGGTSQRCNTIGALSHEKEGAQNEKHEYQMIHDGIASCIEVLHESTRLDPIHFDEGANFKCQRSDMQKASRSEAGSRFGEIPKRQNLLSPRQLVPAIARDSLRVNLHGKLCAERDPVVQAINLSSGSATRHHSIHQVKQQPAANVAQELSPRARSSSQGSVVQRSSIQGTNHTLVHLHKDRFTV